MIEIVNPGWLSLVVDGGRTGYKDVGVPTSAALDQFAYRALHYLTGQDREGPVVEVLGSGFAARFHTPLTAAITGARVKAFVDDRPVPCWTSFPVKAGAVLRIREVAAGFRYYLGFNGLLAADKIIGSYATNLECRFGGYEGRALTRGDHLAIARAVERPLGILPEDLIPVMGPPHRLRIIEGPEADFFTPESRQRFLAGSPLVVSGQSNRTGIRLSGTPLEFRKGAEKSIISEGILPGTIQIPGDGLPILALHERTIGGYARLGTIAKVDQNRLAHLKPGDPVFFEMISLEEAEGLWEDKRVRDALLFT